MDERIDIYLDFDDVAINSYNWFEQQFLTLEIYERVSLIFKNAIKREQDPVKRREYEIVFDELEKVHKIDARIASDRYIKLLVTSLKDDFDKVAKYLRKTHDNTCSFEEREYYEFAAKGLLEVIEEKREQIKQHYIMKDKILEEMGREFVNLLDFTDILKIANVKKEYISFIERALADDRVEHVYIESHCNVAIEELLKEIITHRLFGDKVVFIPLLFHNRQIDKHNEGDYAPWELTEEYRKKHRLRATSKYDYARTLVNEFIEGRTFKDRHSVLIDDSISNCVEYEDDSIGHHGTALIYAEEPLSDDKRHAIAASGFPSDAVISSLADYDDVMDRIFRRMAIRNAQSAKR